MQHQLSVNLLKVWWRLEAFLERFKRAVSCGYEDPTEPVAFRRDYHGGYGNTYQTPKQGGFWVAGAILVSSILICVVLCWLSSRITSLEDKVSALTSERHWELQK